MTIGSGTRQSTRWQPGTTADIIQASECDATTIDMNPNLLKSMVGLTLLLGNAQSAQAQAATPAAQAQAALAGEWRQVSPDASTLPLTLTLDGRSTLSASVGCNVLNGMYAARGHVLLTSRFSSTRMACEPQTAAAEASALERLRGLTHYALDGEVLTLSGTAGDLVLRRTGVGLGLSSEVAPTPTPAAIPTDLSQENIMDNPARSINPAGHWRVRSLSVGGQALTVDPAAALTISAQDGGWKLAGTLGCNSLSALAQSGGTGSEWQLSTLSMTRMACPPAQAQAETALANILGGPVTVTQAGDMLTLTAAAGTLVLEVAPPVAPQDWATTYQGEQLRLEGHDFTLTPPFTLSVTPQGEGLLLSGNAGCNRITATAEADGQGGWTLAPAAATRMACKDMSAEEQVLRLLSKPAKLFREGERLALRSDLGELQLQPIQASASATAPTAASEMSSGTTRLSGRYTLTELRQDGKVLDLAGFDRPVTLSFDEATDAMASEPSRSGRLTAAGARFSGSDGCNSIGAGYEWDAASNQLHLTTPLISSLAFCPSLQNLPSLAQTLNTAPTATLQGDTLTLSAGGVKWMFRRD